MVQNAELLKTSSRNKRELRMLRWISSVTRKSRRKLECICEKLEVKPNEDGMRENWLR